MRILLIEDDRNLCRALSCQLKQEHFSVDCCYHGNEAAFYLKQQIYDMILLDCILPGTDGISLLREMRNREDFTPVIILSALGEIEDRVYGLNVGADDYLVKPFAFSELLARINSHLRRKQDFCQESFSFGDLILKPEKRTLECNGNVCNLSKTEYELMRLLLQGGEHTLARSVLLHKIWGIDTEVEDSNLDNYIYFLRKRLRKLSSHVVIRNQRGNGYFLQHLPKM